MPRLLTLALVLGLVAAAIVVAQGSPTSAPKLAAGKWWNTPKPIALGEGKVSIVHFWTFGCSNCEANQPIYRRWTTTYKNSDVQIVGIHTPELANERQETNVTEYIALKHVEYPVLMDGQSTNWRRWQNHFWPAVYVVDRKGMIRGKWEGELTYGGATRDREVEALVAQLVKESAKR